MNKQLPSAFVTALRTLTILPIPGRDAEIPAKALSWFPIVGAILGLAVWAVAAFMLTVLPSFPSTIVAVTVVIAGVLLTRGLHLDGLADWADAFWGGWTRERRLEIMKDSSLGTYGTLALILLMIAKWSAISELVDRADLAWLLIACILSRTVQVYIATRFPYARPEGGTGAAFINQPGGLMQCRQGLLIAFALTFILGAFTWRPLVVAIIALFAGHMFGRASRKAIGGVTGDILGAASELTETLVLILAACLPQF